MVDRTSLRLIGAPVLGPLLGGWWGLATGVLVAAVLYVALTNMRVGGPRPTFIGWCLAVCALAGVSTGGWVTQEALERGVIGVLAAQALLWCVAQADWYLHHGS